MSNISEIYLRTLEVSDYETVNLIRDGQGVYSNISGNKFFISAEREKKWIKSLIFDNNKNYWAICLKSDNKMIGFCSIIDIDWRNRKANIGGMSIFNKYRNNGYGIYSLKLILNFAFQELGLNKISLEYKENNKVTEHGIEKLGFKKETLLRENIFKQGKFYNVVIVSILESEYREQLENEV
ncbi:MAG: GNAT family N-acetyltransferase [Bacteroidales bacterium]|nr:GNAT family N-acetyltransferase [Bacteroidales bacterium]MBN2757716.1 GNAT family N-acetyltransferase [Bacteroidales bacterium]